MDTKGRPSTILLKGDPTFKELMLNGDVYSAIPITPGMLCERTATNTVQPHSSAAGVASPIFAVENAIIGRGKEIPYTVDGEAVLLAFCRPGDSVLALLEAGAGNVTVIGTLLNSNGAGLLQVGDTNAVARALEVVDNDPGVGSAAMWIRVEVL